MKDTKDKSDKDKVDMIFFYFLLDYEILNRRLLRVERKL